MANSCSKCGKKLGILSGKYKTEEGSVMCGSCFKKWIKEQEEKNRKIMRDIISKYLSNKDNIFTADVCLTFQDVYSMTKKRERHFMKLLNKNTHLE